MKNKDLPFHLRYANLSSNNANDDFMEIKEIEENPQLYFAVKTLKGLMNSLLAITYNEDLDAFKEIYNVAESIYEKSGGEKNQLPFITAQKLTNSSRELTPFYLFLADKTDDIFSFVDNIERTPCNFFSLFLKYGKFDIAIELLNKYEVEKSLDKDNILNFNNNPYLPIYHPDEWHIPFAENFIANSLSKSSYLNRQLLILSSLKSFINHSSINKKEQVYWDKLIAVTGNITPEEQEFFLCWILAEKRDDSILQTIGINRGMKLNAHSGKALYEVCYRLEDSRPLLFDFIKPYISELTNNAERDNINLGHEWIKKHPIWERTAFSSYFNEIKKIENQVNGIYSFLYPDTERKFDFYSYKDHFLSQYKSFYYNGKYSPETEKEILNTYFEIDNHFEAMRGLIKEEPRKIKRL